MTYARENEPKSEYILPIAAAAAGLGDVDSIVRGLAVLEPVTVDDPVVVVGARVLVADPPVLAPVASAPGQTAAVGNVTLALDSSLVSKPSQCLEAAEEVATAERRNDSHVTDLLSDLNSCWDVLVYV
ncbi:MAG: hypothetical protein Q9178_006386 [Gyalolechia marmorata]